MTVERKQFDDNVTHVMEEIKEGEMKPGEYDLEDAINYFLNRTARDSIGFRHKTVNEKR